MRETWEIFADNVEFLMKKRGLSQRELARRAGLHDPAITRLLARESKNPELKTIEGLARALGVSACGSRPAISLCAKRASA